MRNSMLVIRNLAIVICFTTVLFGCGEKQNETSVKPKVVSQKITIEKDTGQKPAEKTTGAKTREAPPKTTVETAGAAKTGEVPDTGALSSDPVKTLEKKTGAMVDTTAGEVSLTQIAYIPEGKIDPFAPLFSEKTETEEEPSNGEGKPGGVKRVKAGPRRIPRTPLEKLDLSQLKLVGIIRSEKGNKAIVQDASGKGYVLNKGTFIGNNSGFVTQITKNKVIIEEEEDDEAVDTDGLVTIHQRELVLQKPVGEI